MTLSAALQLVVDDLAAQVHVSTARVHPGIFDAQEMSRAIVQAPALLLACAGLMEADDLEGDQYEYSAALALYLPVRDEPGRPRTDSVLDDLVWPLLGYIPGREFGSPWSGPAGSPVARNLYSTTIDSRGVALWSVEWDQSIFLPRLPQPGILAPR
jgi:hypothetical protein